VTARYLPREVFFDRLGFAGAFFMVGASDLGRFLPATCDSLPIDVFPGHPTEVAPLAAGRLLPARPYALSVHADLLETARSNRGTNADRATTGHPPTDRQ
jgi:hypothetical protein